MAAFAEFAEAQRCSCPVVPSDGNGVIRDCCAWHHWRKHRVYPGDLDFEGYALVLGTIFNLQALLTLIHMQRRFRATWPHA